MDEIVIEQSSCANCNKFLINSLEIRIPYFFSHPRVTELGYNLYDVYFLGQNNKIKILCKKCYQSEIRIEYSVVNFQLSNPAPPALHKKQDAISWGFPSRNQQQNQYQHDQSDQIQQLEEINQQLFNQIDENAKVNKELSENVQQLEQKIKKLNQKVRNLKLQNMRNKGLEEEEVVHNTFKGAIISKFLHTISNSDEFKFDMIGKIFELIGNIKQHSQQDYSYIKVEIAIKEFFNTFDFSQRIEGIIKQILTFLSQDLKSVLIEFLSTLLPQINDIQLEKQNQRLDEQRCQNSDEIISDKLIESNEESELNDLFNVESEKHNNTDIIISNLKQSIQQMIS
ncbi:hypothetical protein OXYTRIMIC_255 [Oxytricha trifallax]|uniref:Uncharacterized protein n=1 Tax=Oxytricha trifallax TaxID=1172189 RepID=A0A073HZ85_9SPIT|nr:hypothetical protein OXYTRIMIC_255 [Oxytricha trifallax]